MTKMKMITFEVREDWEPYCFLADVGPNCRMRIVGMVDGKIIEKPHIREECFGCPFRNKEYIAAHPEMDQRWVK